MDNKTWHLVLPSSTRDIIDCKWVYYIKKNDDGTVDVQTTFSCKRF
jgi:hypothetical protein